MKGKEMSKEEMSPSRCRTCGSFLHGRAHKCPPCWDVWSNDEGHEAGCIEIYAPTSQGAVEQWAVCEDEQYGPGIINGDNVTVCVMRHGSDTIHRYIVTGESVPQYYARLVTQ